MHLSSPFFYLSMFSQATLVYSIYLLCSISLHDYTTISYPSHTDGHSGYFVLFQTRLQLSFVNLHPCAEVKCVEVRLHSQRVCASSGLPDVSKTISKCHKDFTIFSLLHISMNLKNSVLKSAEKLL